MPKEQVIAKASREIHSKLEILLRSDNVSVLMGAGCSMAAGGVSLAAIPLQFEKLLLESGLKGTTVQPWLTLLYSAVHLLTGRSIGTAVDRKKSLDDFEKSTDKNKRWDSIGINIEEFLTRLHTWLAACIGDEIEISTTAAGKLKITKSNLERLIAEMTATLVRLCKLPITGKEAALEDHKRFLRKLLRRPLNLRRASLFTLNYDTLLEQAADGEGIILLNGFVGSLARNFRPESFDHDFYFPGDTTEGKVHRLERVLHLYKVHGSLTWKRVEPSWNNPYGVEEIPLRGANPDEDVLVYPTPLKYGEVLGFPYSELFRRFANNVVRPQSVLFVLGYSFGDEHVNAIIRQALAIPSFNLVIVNPNASGDFVSKVEAAGDKRIWIVRGWDLGTFSGFVQQLMPDLDDEESLKRIIDTYNRARR
ncbi:SIR2 family protein [Candidatus Obscuribacterales bacterium]|nr:SIR2 family protein [Candidatus Obscuribacterales bacterium]